MKSGPFSDNDQSSRINSTVGASVSFSEDGAMSEHSEHKVLELFHIIRSMGKNKIKVSRDTAIHTIEKLINDGVDVEAVRDVVGIDAYGRQHAFSPIRLAVYLGHEDVIRILIDAGAKVDNGRFDDQKTTMALAVEGKHVNIISVLCEEGGALDPTEENPIGPLEIAAYAGNAYAVNILLSHGADISLVAPNGRNPLMTAAFEGQEGVVAALASEYESDINLDINHGDEAGNTALMLGIISGNSKIVERLLKAQSNVFLQNKAEDDAFMLASYHGNEKIMQLLLNYGASTETSNAFGQTPLISAVSKGKSKAVSWLLSRTEGVDINSVMQGGWTSIMIALKYGHHEIIGMLMDENNKRFLDLNKVNDDGESVFDIATSYVNQGIEGYQEILDSLLEMKSTYNERRPLERADSFVVGLDGIQEEHEEHADLSDISSLSSEEEIQKNSDLVQRKQYRIKLEPIDAKFRSKIPNTSIPGPSLSSVSQCLLGGSLGEEKKSETGSVK